MSDAGLPFIGCRDPGRGPGRKVIESNRGVSQGLSFKKTAASARPAYFRFMGRRPELDFSSRSSGTGIRFDKVTCKKPAVDNTSNP